MRIWLALLCVLLLLAAACGGGGSPTQTPPRVGGFTGTGGGGCVVDVVVVSDGSSPTPTSMNIKFTNSVGGYYYVNAAVADNPAARATGLMNIPCLPSDDGMIFAWHTDTTTGFWMENTEVPLTIAFIQADGKIVHIEDMQPETTNIHNSPDPYRYAIEANRGWFDDHGLKVGDTAVIPEGLSSNAKD